MKRILPLVLTLGLLACQRDAEEIISPKKESSVITQADSLSNRPELKWVALTQDYYISEDEAKDLALSFAQQTHHSQLSKKGVRFFTKDSPIEIESIKAVRKSNYSSFRSLSLPENDIYIINFKNNQGYVLTAADKRVPGIFAYNDTGHWGDTLTNPTQALLYENMLNYVEIQRTYFEKERKKLAQKAWEDLTLGYSEKEKDSLYKAYFDKDGNPQIIGAVDVINPSTPRRKNKDKDEYPYPPDLPYRRICQSKGTIMDYGVCRLHSSVDELLKTSWRQRSPYNNLISYNCGYDKAPVGCVAIAVGQIMSYYKKPTIFEGRIMHWNDMIIQPTIGKLSAQAQYDVQYLLATLGKKNLLGMKYTCEGSGASIYSALNTFKKLGYTDVSIIDNDPNSHVGLEIENKRLVYIRGIDPTTKEGHAWVIDGIKVYVVPLTITTEIGCLRKVYHSSLRCELFHHNLGWGEGAKGWYVGYYFGNKTDEVVKSNPSFEMFKENVKIITNIY